MRFIQFFGFIFTISIFNYSIGQLTLPPSLITSNVPEASQYKVVYDLTIPTASGTITYAQNNSNASGVVYNKVAYFMQLDTKWVWVSMDKFNANLTLSQLAIPVLNSGIVFQQIVTGMNVTTSGNTGITNVTNGNGNIEFWPYCYGTSNGLSGIGGDISKYDFNDLMDVNLNQCYGSFQVHNYNASQTLFAFNNFVSAGQTPDLGIGNNSGVASNGQSNPDWTFMGNSPNYTTRKLYILVDACSEISVTTQPNSAALNLTQNSTGNSLSVGASTTFGNINSYQWYSNSSATYSGSTLISGASSATYIIPTSTIGSNYYYCVIGNTNGCSVNSAISGLVKVDPYVWNGSVSNALTNASNWSSGDVPPNGSSITFAASASNNLVLDANRTYGAINFNGSNKKIELGNFNLTATSIIGVNALNYVKTTGTGKLEMTLANNTNTVYPVGNSSYNPLSITNKSGASDVFSVRVVDGAFMEGLTGAAITSTVLNRTWDISKTNANAGSGVDFVFNWNAGEVANGSFLTPKMNHYSSSTSNWEVPTVTSTVFGSNMLTVTGYTGTFSPFTIAEGTSALPIELTAFNANCIETATTINWQTASEHNSATFELEKSRDGINWTSVETVQAAGNSTTMINYSVIDSDKTTGVVYYRLNQMDQDGESKIYGPISANCFDTKDFTATVFPNPASGMVTIEMNAPKAQTLSIQICGTDGKVIEQIANTLEEGTTQIPLSIATLKAGVYTVKVNGENTFKTIKLIVQ
jgi:hypothetical protein